MLVYALSLLLRPCPKRLLSAVVFPRRAQFPSFAGLLLRSLDSVASISCCLLQIHIRKMCSSFTATLSMLLCPYRSLPVHGKTDAVNPDLEVQGTYNWPYTCHYNAVIRPPSRAGHHVIGLEASLEASY